MERDSKAKKIGLIVLIVLNLVVLLGQIWPEGAPPFAKYVNIVFLLSSMIFFTYLLVKPKSK